MPKYNEPQANFAKHPAGQCSFCDAGAVELCAAFQLYLYSGGDEEAWRTLRSFFVPGTGKYMGRTVWQLVCAAERITDVGGGKYRDRAGETPTPQQVVLALAMGSVTVEA